MNNTSKLCSKKSKKTSLLSRCFSFQRSPPNPSKTITSIQEESPPNPSKSIRLHQKHTDSSIQQSPIENSIRPESVIFFIKELESKKSYNYDCSIHDIDLALEEMLLLNYNDIFVIMNINGICWFNSLIYTTLYSDLSRKLVLEKIKSFENNDIISNNLLHRLIRILLYMYKKPYQSMISYNIHSLNQIISIYLLFICNFKENLLIKYDKDIKYICSNIDHLISNINDIPIIAYTGFDYIYNIYSLFKIKTLKLLYNYKDIKLYNNKNINTINIPDIIAINYNKKYEFDNDDRFNNIKKDIGEKTIIYNGYSYNLDSSLITNKNITHQIAGIHINGIPVIYDSMSYNKKEKMLCNLFNFDWKSNLNKDFCKIGRAHV